MVYCHGLHFCFVYICDTFSLLLVYHGFFLSCMCFWYFFGYTSYIKRKTYRHIFMVINNKLVIDYDILKIILAKTNQTVPYTPHRTARVIA